MNQRFRKDVRKRIRKLIQRIEKICKINHFAKNSLQKNEIEEKIPDGKVKKKNRAKKYQK